jgi:Ferritin-like domain
MNEHLSDVQTLRDNARSHIGLGPLTAQYGADRDRLLAVLNEVLATELVCVLRYKRHHFMASGINSAPVAAEFLQHATEEQGHADLVAARIVQLQGEPDFNPATLEKRSHAEYITGDTLIDTIVGPLAFWWVVSEYQRHGRPSVSVWVSSGATRRPRCREQGFLRAGGGPSTSATIKTPAKCVRSLREKCAKVNGYGRWRAGAGLFLSLRC